MDRWNWLAECLAESFQFSSSCSSQDLLGNITHSVVLYVVADSVEIFRLITADIKYFRNSWMYVQCKTPTLASLLQFRWDLLHVPVSVVA